MLEGFKMTDEPHNLKVPQENQGIFSPFLRQQRYKRVAQLISQNETVLDLGCGKGALKQHLPDSTIYYGIDTKKHWNFHSDFLFVSKVENGLPKQLSNINFTTITALAILEHLKHPIDLFSTASQVLPVGGKLVLTTPHPIGRKIHDWGAKIGLFSNEASEEHETFLDQLDMIRIAKQAGFKMVHYRRFLLGMNQIAVFVKN